MPWLELQLTIDAAHQARAEAALAQLGALSVTVCDAAAGTPDETSIFAPGAGDMPAWKSSTLLALFEHGTNAALLVAALRNALPTIGLGEVGAREVADRDWEHAWMDRWRPLRFGRRLWIYPWNIEPPRNLVPDPASATASGEARGDTALPATRSPTDTAAILRLDPGLAFGTGTHPTTALCLEWLDAAKLAGKTVIDYGCGSGVLAIAALKLGAARAIGVDNDPQAITATLDNAARNGVGGQLDAWLPGELPEHVRADVLLANILLGPLTQLAPFFASLCQPGAPIVLSGILATQADEVRAHYAASGFAALHATPREEWVRIDGRRTRQAPPEAETTRCS